MVNLVKLQNHVDAEIMYSVENTILQSLYKLV